MLFGGGARSCDGKGPDTSSIVSGKKKKSTSVVDPYDWSGLGATWYVKLDGYIVARNVGVLSQFV